MNKYLVIGNPIDHSLSPTIHNYWIKKNNIKAIYDKQRLDSDDLKNLMWTMFDFYEIYGKRSPQWIYSEDFPPQISTRYSRLAVLETSTVVWR